MASSGSATAASDTPVDVAVIDYGMGNLHSVASALESVAPEARVVITDDGAQIARARRVVLPGVGAIRDCMQAIRDQGVDRVIAEVMARRTPLLGVCGAAGAARRQRRERRCGGARCVPGASAQLFRL